MNRIGGIFQTEQTFNPFKRDIFTERDIRVRAIYPGSFQAHCHNIGSVLYGISTVFQDIIKVRRDQGTDLEDSRTSKAFILTFAKGDFFSPCESGITKLFYAVGSVCIKIRKSQNPAVLERRGSGLRKIVSETEKLPGYTAAYKPEFSSTATDFRVILKNVNYNLEDDTHQVIHQVIHQVTHQDIELSTVSKQILAFCTTPKSKKELAVFCGFKDLRNFTLKHINPLLESGQLEMTIPDKPKSRNQKYITVRSE